MRRAAPARTVGRGRLKGNSMEKDQKYIRAPHDEPGDTRAKVVVAVAVIALGLAALLVCIYSVIPELLS